jgi:hypothetical protein
MKKIPYQSHDVLICECYSPEHQMVISYGDDELIDGTIIHMVYIHTHLVKKSFWSRLKYGLKYIFGYKSQYGAWDEFILNPNDAEKLQDIVDYLKEKKNEKTILG